MKNLLSFFSDFLDRLNIRNKLILLTLFVGLALFLAISVISSLQSYNTLMDNKKHELKMTTDMALNTINMYATQAKEGTLSTEEAQARAIASLEKLIYDDGQGYLWVQDYDSNMLMHPFSKKLIGTNLADVGDKKGFKFFQSITNSVKSSGEGYITYFWTKPNKSENELFEKLSYGKGYADWKWIVATGIYTDDVQTTLIASITKTMVYSLILLVLIIFITNFTIVKNIVNPIQYLTDMCLKLADNDLSVIIKEDKNETEIGYLSRSIATLASNIRNLVMNIQDKSNSVSSSSQELLSISETSSQVSTQVTETVEQMAAGSQTQAKEVTDSAEKISRIAESSNIILENIKKINEAANESVKQVEEGQSDVEKTIQKITEIKRTNEEIASQMQTLGSLGQEIGKIVDLITNIASQTNLLALNAAIESARAGEHGKGFAVVAEEVKKLADESAEAANQIKGMIEQIQSESSKAVESTKLGVKMVEEGVNAVQKVKQVFMDINVKTTESERETNEIYSSVKNMSEQNEEVATAMENVSAVTEESAASSEEIAASMEEQNAGMEELAASAHDLANLAKELNDSVSIFKV